MASPTTPLPRDPVELRRQAKEIENAFVASDNVDSAEAVRLRQEADDLERDADVHDGTPHNRWRAVAAVVSVLVALAVVVIVLVSWLRSTSTQKEPAIPNVQATATVPANPPNLKKTSVVKKATTPTLATLKIATPSTTATDSSAIALEIQKLRGEIERLRQKSVPVPTINFPSELTVRLLPQQGSDQTPVIPVP